MDPYLLMHKLLTEEISDNEREMLNNWLDQDPKHREDFEEIKLIWENAGYVETELPYDPEEERLKLQERIRRSSEKQIWLTLYSTKTLFFMVVGMLLLIAATTVWVLLRPNYNNTMQVGFGKQHNIILLPDGSELYLNRHSFIKFSDSENNREAVFNGEAYFDIEKDAERPFLINVHNAVIKVLGTSFYVNSFPDSRSTEVVVVSGSVEVASPVNREVLRPGEKGIIIHQNGEISKSTNIDPNFNSWKTGELKFENVPVSSILQVLEKHYYVTILVENANLLNCRFTGTFENDELEKVLKVISYGINFEYQYREGKYYLKGGDCEKTQIP